MTILAFSLLIYPSYVPDPYIVDITYDTIVMAYFQITMSAQLTSCIFFFAAVYNYDTDETTFFSLIPIFVNVMPTALLAIEFYIDMIYFVA